MFHSEKAKKRLANAVTLEEIRIPPHSIFLVTATCNTLAQDGDGHMTSSVISNSN